MAYGKFSGFSEFIDSYTRHESATRQQALSGLKLGQQIAFIKKHGQKDVVETDTICIEHQPDEKGSAGDIHYQLKVKLIDIIARDTGADADTVSDIQRCLSQGAPVFVAVRFGDSEGISQPITSGLDAGSKLHIKGVWIPMDKAFNHGGEKMSVLHFTHHPVGFICTTEKCYQ